MVRKVQAPASGAIVIGCKLPHGLHLDVEGTRVTLNGTNASNVIGGYGLTENVDAEFFGAWCTRNSQHPALVNELIFAQATTVEAKAQATDEAERKNGFEGIDPAKPATAVAGVEKADGQQ